jgi:hypothetical protein
MASGTRDSGAVTCAPFVMGEAQGAIVAGFDVHQRQIIIDTPDAATGKVSRGQIESTPAGVEETAAGFPAGGARRVEACRASLFVSWALARCGRGGALGRADGDQPAERAQASRQDRPCRH